jgi:hypothetical protein
LPVTIKQNRKALHFLVLCLQSEWNNFFIVSQQSFYYIHTWNYASFHDSSACIIKDGQLIAAAEEERFTQIKHGKRPIPFSTYELPFNSIDYCLKMANIHLSDVDNVAYSFDPYLLLGEEKGKATIEIPLEPGMATGPSKWHYFFPQSFVPKTI